MNCQNQRVELPSIQNIFNIINNDLSNNRNSSNNALDELSTTSRFVTPQPSYRYPKRDVLLPPSPASSNHLYQSVPNTVPPFPSPVPSTRNFNNVFTTKPNASINEMSHLIHNNKNYTTSIKYYNDMYNNPQQRFSANIVTSNNNSNGLRTSPPTSPLSYPVSSPSIIDNKQVAGQLGFQSIPNSPSMGGSLINVKINKDNKSSADMFNRKTAKSNNRNSNDNNENINTRKASKQVIGTNKITKKTSTKRSNLPKKTVEILNNWLLSHLHDPYPSPEEKLKLLEQTGLTKVQLSNWFINVRRRKVFVDQANHNHGNTKSIYRHPHNNANTKITS